MLVRAVELEGRTQRVVGFSSRYATHSCLVSHWEQAEEAWLEAMLGGEPSPGSFLNAAAITDTVNLGTVALRAGGKVVFDSEKMQITNLPAANKYLRR